MSRPTRTPILILTIVALILGLGASTALEAQEPLTLRINDAEGRAGGLLALVLRTYASRQLGQGQVGVRASVNLHQGLGPSDILSDPRSAVVFSDEGDARHRFEVDNNGGDPRLSLLFRSPTASVNQSDGPLAVLYFRLPETVVPGEEIDVVVDPLESFLFDHLGDPVPIAAAAGRVRVLGPGDRFGVSAGAEDTVPGESAILSLQTAEVQRLSAGQAAFRFQPSLFVGPPVVTIDPRYGNATWTVDDTVPGLVIVAFESADVTLNSVPGDIVTVALPTRADILPGTTSPIRLDRDLTFLTGRGGQNIPLEIESGELLFQ